MGGGGGVEVDAVARLVVKLLRLLSLGATAALVQQRAGRGEGR